MESNSGFNWRQIARLALTSRTIDAVEETQLYPQKKVLYQFSARGHELGQILLGSLLTHRRDGISAYYRCRPLMLSIGLAIEDALAGPLMTSGGYSEGRDIGVVCNFPSQGGPTVLPMAGDVGSQYTPAAGWAQAIEYRCNHLQEQDYNGAIAVVLGGDGSVATNGFWSSLTIATTLSLPMLFYIEDNGYAISVTGDKQTPGGNIASNLQSFANLHVLDGDGVEPEQASRLVAEAVEYVRTKRSPCLLRLAVPRLSGHSGQDTQMYKGEERISAEQRRDPLQRLEQYLVPGHLSPTEWQQLAQEVEEEVARATEAALQRPAPDTNQVTRYVFLEAKEDGSPDIQKQGGLAAEDHQFPVTSDVPRPEGTRINMATAIRKTIEVELETNSKVLVFGEDVGAKGGVHAVTMGLQKKFSAARVFDTSLSEEGIIGRSVGMAFAGLMPIAEIQFRKYADPAEEQLNNCGTIRWRTANRFAAPIVVRLPGGFFKCGDPWHSVCSEVSWVHGIGWQVVFPANAEDAVGLLRAALRSNNPTIFFEHRALLDNAWARRPYPGDNYLLEMGKAKKIQEGERLTVVTWGAMVERCELAAKETGLSVEILDLRTLMPWDKQAILDSVRKTNKCLIVHEDTITAGFGAEIAAVLAKEAFFDLDAPIERIAPPDIPIPHNVDLMNAMLPGVEDIAQKIRDLVEF